jgi:molybdopterin molybdotransferase
LRATLGHTADGTLEAEPFKKQDSSMISLLARADCLVIRAPLASPAKAGDWVEIIPLTAL